MRTPMVASRVQPKLSRGALYEAVATQSGLPENLLDSGEYEQLIGETLRLVQRKLHGQEAPLATLESALKSRIAERFVGWNEAIRTLAPNWDRRPIATILAVGPTGVGKSETAKMLADLLFGGRLILLNCTEVGPDAPHAGSMWTGSPPGYVGSDRGGVLTNGLRMHHSGVILIDELEKADKTAVENIILPLMGDGAITDKNNGETLFATDFVVFCTSNIPINCGSVHALGFSRLASGAEPDDRSVFDSLSAHLRPEILGRFNAILCYRELALETQWQIWSALRHELAAKIGPGTQIVLNGDAKRFVQDKFRVIETGARGIRDLFNDLVVPLATRAQAGTIITVGYNGYQLKVVTPERDAATLQGRKSERSEA